MKREHHTPQYSSSLKNWGGTGFLALFLADAFFCMNLLSSSMPGSQMSITLNSTPLLSMMSWAFICLFFICNFTTLSPLKWRKGGAPRNKLDYLLLPLYFPKSWKCRIWQPSWMRSGIQITGKIDFDKKKNPINRIRCNCGDNYNEVASRRRRNMAAALLPNRVQTLSNVFLVSL